MSDVEYYVWVESLNDMARDEPTAFLAELGDTTMRLGKLAPMVEALRSLEDADVAMAQIRKFVAHPGLVVQECALSALNSHSAHREAKGLMLSVLADSERHPVIRQIAQEYIDDWED